jgi:hypothetical protein
MVYAAPVLLALFPRKGWEVHATDDRHVDPRFDTPFFNRNRPPPKYDEELHLRYMEALAISAIYTNAVFAAIDDEARYFEVRVHGAPLDDAVHGPHPLPAAYHLEAAALFRLGDDEVLQHAARLDIEGQSLLEFGIGPLADIVFALIELAQRDELHDRIS